MNRNSCGADAIVLIVGFGDHILPNALKTSWIDPCECSVLLKLIYMIIMRGPVSHTEQVLAGIPKLRLCTGDVVGGREPQRDFKGV